MSINIIKDKKIVLALLFVIIIASLITTITMTKKESQEAIAFEEVRAKKGNIKIDLVSDGVIELNVVSLQFGVNGILSQILVDEGQKVETGDTIARLDDRKYLNEVEIARAKLEKANADLEKIKLQYLPMEKIPDAYAPVEIQTKKLDLDISNADIQEAQVNLKKAEDSLLDTYLKSPLEGTVVQINGKEGEVVSSSSDSSKAFAIISENNVKVVAKVLEIDIGMVSVGQKAEIITEAFPDEPITGTVSKIAFLPNTDNNGIIAYAVDIELDEENESLRDGMTCTISFILKEVKDVVILPNRAVKIVDGKQVVDILQENGETSSREIKTGFTDGSYVEIKEGLQPGDVVLLNK